MPRRSSRSVSGPDLYEEITCKILSELEAGRVPWVQPWRSDGAAALVGLPSNAATGRTYSGINILILWGAVIERGFACQSWLTFRQALSLGGNVRKGERGTMVVYADSFIPKKERRRSRETGDEPGRVHFLKRFTVFNIAQCDDLPDDLVEVPPPVPEGVIAPEVESLIRNSRANVRIGGTEAFYSPPHDYIQVPHPDAFVETIDWHRTALHELGHWTGAKHRLDRDMTGRFGSAKYAREELVAEISAAFTCATLGIEPTVRHADYIGSWLDVLREDNRAIIRAASAASKAADFLLAFRGDEHGVSASDSASQVA